MSGNDMTHKRGRLGEENSREEVPESVEVAGERVRVSEEEVREPDGLSALKQGQSPQQKGERRREPHVPRLSRSRKPCVPANG